MPVGNGELVATVFPLAETLPTAGNVTFDVGVHMWVSMPRAMSSSTLPYTIAMVSLMTDPPLLAGASTTEFTQSLDTSNGTVTIATSVGTVTTWVDATTNAIRATVVGASDISLSVHVQSLHPSSRFSWLGGTADPDVFVAAGTPLPANSVCIYHRNEDTDEPAAVNDTLTAQGLAGLVDKMQQVDAWRHLQSGVLVSGSAGLARTANGTLTSAAAAASFDVTITGLANQTDTAEEWVAQISEAHGAAVATETEDARRLHQRSWDSFWDRSHISVTSASDPAADAVTTQYAVARYVQYIQAGTWVPIKFNGMLFGTGLPPATAKSGPDFRDWGECSWWQNTRLPYWTTYAAADWDMLSTLFEWYLRMLPFNSARTLAYFNHTGTFYTETKTMFGAYRAPDYGDKHGSGAGEFPVWEESNPYIHLDFGGDAGGPEISLMILDQYLYTMDADALTRYLPIVDLTLEFFAQHYGDSSPLRIFPTQALETYWCPSPPPYTPENCLTNDAPTVAGLHALTERVLQLPTALTTPDQRARWSALAGRLPPNPMTLENNFKVVSPYETYPNNSALHNSETPELYGTHPFREYTVGRSLAGDKRDIAPSVYCMLNSTRRTCQNAGANGGWTQGSMNAALLGLGKKAQAMVSQRAQTGPAEGYRFQGFAPHEQDYEPSSDHFANMMSTLNWMLVSPADDGLEAASAILFPAWPCEWDVDFKVAAPGNTTVSGSLVNGTLTSLVVDPPARKSAILVQPCQS